MEQMTSRDEDCVLVNGHALGYATIGELVQMAERLAAYEDMDSKRLRPGDTVWLSRMFYTRPKKPVPVTVDAIRIDREGTTYITGRKRFCEDAIGRTVFLTEEEAERDAALADLADARSCKTCKYACDTRDCSSCKSKTCKCRECHLDKNAWEWRGLSGAPEVE